MTLETLLSEIEAFVKQYRLAKSIEYKNVVDLLTVEYIMMMEPSNELRVKLSEYYLYQTGRDYVWVLGE